MLETRTATSIRVPWCKPLTENQIRFACLPFTATGFRYKQLFQAIDRAKKAGSDAEYELKANQIVNN